MAKTELKYKFPSEYAEEIGFEYSNLTSSEHKKESGQFLTSKEISDFMGNYLKKKFGEFQHYSAANFSTLISVHSMVTHKLEHRN